MFGTPTNENVSRTQTNQRNNKNNNNKYLCQNIIINEIKNRYEKKNIKTTQANKKKKKMKERKQ